MHACLMGLLETVANSRKGSRLSLFIPLFQPHIGANCLGHLAHGITGSGTAGLLGANDPFVVTIPAVKGLVLGGEALVTGSGTDLLDHGQNGSLFLVQFRKVLGENLYIE